MVTQLYPFQSRFFDRSGLKMHFIDEGSGPAVVMLHGNPTWSFYYRNLVKSLRGQFRCIVPDHIGCGLSDKPSSQRYSYSLADRIQDLTALLDHLAIDRCTLIVHDWGGMIGAAWAVRHAEQVRSLVAMNTAAFRKPASKKLPTALWLGRNTWLGTVLIRGLNLFCSSAASVGVQRKPLPPEVRKEYLRPYNSWRNRIAVDRFVKTIPLAEHDPGFDIILEVEQGLAALRDRPIMCAWGLRDFVFDQHFLNEWLVRFPHAVVHRYEDAGHYVLEDAEDDLRQRIHAFLTANA